MNKEITPPPFTVVNEKGKERKVKHGLYAYQKKLCRCDFCKKTASTSIKKYTDLARERFKADPTSLTKHGTYGYQIGCRCDICLNAVSEMDAKKHEADSLYFKEHGVFRSEATQHGSSSGYQNGCRCDSCRNWKSDQWSRLKSDSVQESANVLMLKPSS